jgi:hypothetical protein
VLSEGSITVSNLGNFKLSLFSLSSIMIDAISCNTVIELRLVFHNIPSDDKTKPKINLS